MALSKMWINFFELLTDSYRSKNPFHFVSLCPNFSYLITKFPQETSILLKHVYFGVLQAGFWNRCVLGRAKNRALFLSSLKCTVINNSMVSTCKILKKKKKKKKNIFSVICSISFYLFIFIFF